MSSRIILKNLINYKEYSAKVFPYIKKEYFDDFGEKVVFEILDDYVNKYSSLPTIDILRSELGNQKISQDVFDSASSFVDSLTKDYQTPDLQYLIDVTEDWCKSQACRRALEKAIPILHDKSNKYPLTMLPDLFNQALSVNFTQNLGHDYIENLSDRIDKLKTSSAGIPCGLNFIDECLGGGFPKETLNVFVAGTGGGKSLVKSHLCAEYYKRGYNCLYVTLELSDVKIGVRLDANITCIPVRQLQSMSKEDYILAWNKANAGKHGRIIILDYPSHSITTAHLRNILNDLELKSDFKPDFIFVDYLNLLDSARIKSGSNDNSYTTLKAVAEELAGLSKERKCCVITSTQLNRSGYSKSEVGLDNISDSMGIGFTADTIFYLQSDPVLKEMKQIRTGCLKTRFSDKTNYSSVIGVDYERMMLSNFDDDAPLTSPVASLKSKTQKNEKTPNKTALTPRFSGIEV